MVDNERDVVALYRQRFPKSIASRPDGANIELQNYALID